jgi:hypothetical protein
VESLGSRQSALRQSALEWVKASSGPDSSRRHSSGSRRPAVQTPADSSGSCGRKKKGRRLAAARRGAEEEEKGGRRQLKEKGKFWGKKLSFLTFQTFSFDF